MILACVDAPLSQCTYQVWALGCVHMAQEHSLKKRTSALADNYTIQLTGASGTSAGYVNGDYAATDDEAGGRPLYRKIDDSDILIEYWAPLDEWQVRPASDSKDDLISNLNDASGKSHWQLGEE